MSNPQHVSLYEIYKGFLLLIFLVSTNTIGETMGCSMNKIIHEPITKYIFLFLIIWITLDIGTPVEITPANNLGNGILLWIFFIILTRTDIYVMIAVISLIIIMYVLNSYKDYYKKKIVKQKSDKLMRMSKLIERIMKLIEGLIMVLIIGGFLHYFYKQYNDHRKDFSIFKFLFNIHC